MRYADLISAYRTKYPHPAVVLSVVLQSCCIPGGVAIYVQLLAGIHGMRVRYDDDSQAKIPRIRGKTHLRTLNDLDGRTVAARRTRDLVSGLIEDMGGEASVTVACRQLVQRAAVLGAFIEDLETRWIKGETIPADEYLTAINAQRRVLTTLGLKRVPRDVTPDLNSYIAKKAKRVQPEDDELEEDAE